MLPLILQLLILAAPAPKTVAVLNFDNNSGRSDYEHVGKGLAAMMISDLGGVPALQLVEREKMESILKEQSLQRSSLFDSTTAVRTGKLIGAEYIVVGSFAAVQPSMRIDTRVIRVETGEIVKTARVTGKEDKFFDLQQKLAKELIDGLEVALSPEEREKLRLRQEANRVDELQTVALYSNALQAYDGGDYATAVERMVPVMQKAGGATVVQLTYAEAKKRASEKVKTQATEKVKAGLRGLIKRPQ
jgi:TolB-like protein